MSANLAPGPDYSEGLKQVLPLYENELTTEWLLTFLLDLGVERSDGSVQWAIEEGQAGLKRIVAHFLFKNSRVIELEGERFEFKAQRQNSLVLFLSAHSGKSCGTLAPAKANHSGAMGDELTAGRRLYVLPER